MDIGDENGVTKRQNLKQVLNSVPPESSAYVAAKAQLDAQPELPYYISHVWEWFWELSNKRRDNSPISYTEIKAWSLLKKVHVRNYEIKLIDYLDSHYLQFLDAKRSKELKQKTKG